MPTSVSNPEPVEAETGAPMQRVRIGVTGLASVVLLLAVAGAISASVDRRAQESAAERPNVVATTKATDQTAEKQEPLAQLGVAPVNKEPASRADAQRR